MKSSLFLADSILNVLGAFTSGLEYDFFERQPIFVDGSEYVYPINGQVWILLYFSSFAMLTLQSVEILMSWLGLITTLEDFNIPFKYERLTKFTKKYSRSIHWGYILSWTFIAISSYFFPQFYLGLVTFFAYILFVIFLRRAMKDTLTAELGKQTTQSHSQTLKNVKQTVLTSSLMLIICWTGIGISSTFSHFGGHYSTDSKPGNLSLGMIGQNMAIFFGTAFSYTVSWYVSKSLHTFKTIENTRTRTRTRSLLEL